MRVQNRRKGVINIREILFRGKRLDNGKWIEGNLVHTIDRYGKAVDDYYIFPITATWHYDDAYYESEKVDPLTVGQFTGLTDKNGKKIFEGDKLRAVVESFDEEREIICIVKYLEDNAEFIASENPNEKENDIEVWADAEVISNIHDKQNGGD